MKYTHILRLKLFVCFMIFLNAALLFPDLENEALKPFGIVIHGGAGVLTKKTMSAKNEKRYRQKLEEALSAGYRILAGNGSSLDAVEAAVKILEDSPLFNAGKGAVFTADGTNELDASIMDGKTLNAGGAAGLKRIKNPISLARLVMERSPHVLLVGEGAEAFARQVGVEWVSRDYFFTKSRWEALKKIKAIEEKEEKNSSRGKNMPGTKGSPSAEAYGTVGAVALDRAGNLAAATSTGGMMNKKFGRVGDSPIIGAGTYANNNTCAVSATGHGEYFMRSAAAYDVSALMEYKGLSVGEATRQVVEKIKQSGGFGGLIAMDRSGAIAMPFSTEGMYRGHFIKGETLTVQIFKD